MLQKLIERPIAVTMFLVMVLVLGLVSINLLPISLIPSVDIPYITVQVSLPQQSARELEESVVTPLRQQLMQIAGLQDIRSETKDGSGTILLSFEHGSSSDYLFIEVNEKIDRAMAGMPKELERPYVLKAGAADIPAFYINLTVDGDEKFTPVDALFPVSDRFAQLSDFAGNVIVKRIEQLPEVAMVDVNGYVSQEILIIPDREKLIQVGLTPAVLEGALRNINISLGNLTIRDGEYQFNVKVQREARSITDIENAYLKANGRIFRVRDLARVVEHPQKRATVVRSDGRNAVTLAVIKQSDARMSELKAGINELLKHFETDYPGVTFTLTRDQTELLDYSINNLFENIILGILLACLIIFLFMQNLRSAFLITLTMPVALVLSMLFFHLLGISINIISLSGLVLGVGMMVDNSIIVIDNITFRRNTGYTLKEAIVKGTGEVFAPMLSSVLTTCAVFVPLIFLSGIAGALFYDQAMAVVITLFCALAATVTVIPVYFYLACRRQEKSTANRFLARFSFGWFERWYEKTLKFFFRRRWIIGAAFLVAFAGMPVLFAVVRKERLPEMTYTDVLLHVDWNERITLEENDRRTGQLVDFVKPMARQVTEMTGVQQFVLSHTRKTGNSESVVYINSSKGHTVGEIQAAVSEFLKARYPGAIYGFESSGNIFEVVFADKEARLTARLRPTDGQAPDPVKLDSLLSVIAAGLPGTEVAPVAWEEYILFVGRPDVMALYDVSFGELAGVLRSSLNDNTIFTLMQGNFPVPVVVGDNRASLAEILEKASVRRAGLELPVSLFFRETRKQDLKFIVSGAEGNFYPLEFNLPDREVPQTVETIREIVRENSDFEVGFSGSYFTSRGMVWEILVVLAVAVLLLYFILAAQFESIVQPLIILSELVLDIFFTLLALWVLDVSLNIMSLIGIVVTCGIVINDSILKVDTINQLRKHEGMSVIRAILEGGRRRLKPIIMTSLTTILAISPFLTRGDMGSDLQYPLSVATIAGMAAGTLVSIFFVPLIYYSVYKKR
ncbi:MAG: efflux RND transporter permease subunit [Culturomica sp.]|jgi:multidrug efflux pump subunit AcrB|nr:efflux RND transporter permease subunit [Culturomica sp.]